MHLSKFFKNTNFLIELFFSIFIVFGLQSFLGCHAFSDFIVIALINLFFFIIFKVQFPVMRRYVYVLRPKADYLIDMSGEEATS